MNRNPQNGFTLIEVMIAVTILAAMSLALYGASSTMLAGKESSEKRDEVQHSATFALGKIAEDVGMAYFVKSKDILGATFDGEISFQGAEERLDFVSFSHLRFLRDAKESDSVEISYYLVPDPQDPDLRTLMRRESTEIDKNLQEGGRAYPLLEGVRSIRFEYLPVNSKEWKKVWSTLSVDSGNKLPRAVKIQMEIVVPEEEGPRQYSTTVPIRLLDPLSF